MKKILRYLSKDQRPEYFWNSPVPPDHKPLPLNIPISNPYTIRDFDVVDRL